MQLVGGGRARSADPIAWMCVEERGWGATSAAYPLTLLTLEADDDGRATLDDARMTYGGDPGVVEARYQSVPWFVRDGRDPVAALEGARRGAAELVAAAEAVVGTLDPYLVAPGGRPSRDPEQLDLWVRYASGRSVRYLLALDALPAGVQAVRDAAGRFARHLRAEYDAQDAARS